MGPDNRLFKIGRSREHGSYGVSVIDDGPDADDAAKRYKLMWWSGTSDPAGASVAFSPDGIHWTPSDEKPVMPFYPHDHPRAKIGVGDIVDAFHDPIRHRYGALIKLQAMESDGWKAGPRAGKSYRRLVGASFSDDFVHWAKPWRVIVPEPRDEGLLEFYGAGGTIARGPLLISFVRMLHDDYSPEPGGEPTGIGYTTLATSRDGVHWQRHNDIFFDRNPQPGAWDRAMTWVGGALPVGDELYLYYGGYARGHKVEPTKERQLGLATMQRDTPHNPTASPGGRRHRSCPQHRCLRRSRPRADAHCRRRRGSTRLRVRRLRAGHFRRIQTAGALEKGSAAAQRTAGPIRIRVDGCKVVRLRSGALTRTATLDGDYTTALPPGTRTETAGRRGGMPSAVWP
jgi:hypothetical protein